MTDEELRRIDALVAEAMGWVWQITADDYHEGPVRWLVPPDSPRIGLVEASGNEPLSDGWAYGLPHYTADIAAAMDAEEWLSTKRPEHLWDYARALEEICLNVTGFYYCDEHRWWLLAHATPLQRCLAFLKAMGVEAECVRREG